MALKLLLACGVIGPLLFIIVFLIAGATRPGYNAMRHFVSSLSQGEMGWVQIANFVVCGVLVMCFAAGLRGALWPGKGATWGPILLGVFGLCLIGAGIFVADPLLGYPPGEPETFTRQGIIHTIMSLIAFASLIVACFVLARRFGGDPAWRGWAIYSIATGIAVLVFFIGADVAATSPDPNAPSGLIQRLSIIAGWGWIALVALRLMRREPPVSR